VFNGIRPYLKEMSPIFKRLSTLTTILSLFSGCLFAQNFTQNNGQWNVDANWSTGVMPSGTATDVTIAANVIVSGGSYTIGNITQINNNTTMTVASGATLNVGSSTLYNPPTSTTKKSVTFSNAGNLVVDGTLYIFGDLIVSNTLTFNITGSVIVYGNIVMNNGGDIAVSGTGSLQVRGNLSGGNGTHLATSGTATINVTGSIGLGGGNSSITGATGSITTGAGCTCTGNGTGCNVGGAGACSNTVLPVQLMYFYAERDDEAVVLRWGTAIEKNFDFFSVERSSEGRLFSEIGQVKGHGTSMVPNQYTIVDGNPMMGRSYYRLRAVDFDLHSETFQIVSVINEDKKRMVLYPNPVVHDELHIDVNFTSESIIRGQITDVVGSEIMSFGLHSSSNLLMLNLRPGSYIIKLSVDGSALIDHFVVK
jgi:hypothetical protein